MNIKTFAESMETAVREGSRHDLYAIIKELLVIGACDNDLREEMLAYEE